MDNDTNRELTNGRLGREHLEMLVANRVAQLVVADLLLDELSVLNLPLVDARATLEERDLVLQLLNLIQQLLLLLLHIQPHASLTSAKSPPSFI